MEYLENLLPLKVRIIFALSFFIIFGTYDLFKNPKNPKRAKEYGFLASTTLFSVVFAIIHDFITFSISSEYFYIAKGLGRNIEFYPDIIWLAVKASYWAGIIVGLIFLVANNPKDKMMQLEYKILCRKLLYPLFFGLGLAVLGYFISFFAFPFFSIGAEELLEFPQNFEQVAFIHWGTYIGVLIGSIYGAIHILKVRKSLSINY